jgi:hypothetical protein
MHRRTPACVERSMASDPDRRSVVPPNGGRQQERGRARCPSQPSPGTCAPRRSPSFSMCHQRRSVAGRRRVGCPSSVPWAATDATPTPRSGPCWKPCPSYPQSANRPPRLTAPAPLLCVCCAWLGGRSGSSAGSGSCRTRARPTSSVRERTGVLARENRGARTTCDPGRGAGELRRWPTVSVRCCP